MLHTGVISHTSYDNRSSQFVTNNIQREDLYICDIYWFSYVNRDKDQYEAWLRNKCSTEGSKVFIYFYCQYLPILQKFENDRKKNPSPIPKHSPRYSNINLNKSPMYNYYIISHLEDHLDIGLLKWIDQ